MCLHPLIGSSRAQKLMDRGATPTQFWINSEELSFLLKLLLRLRLYKAKWAREFHYGIFDEECSQDDELARIFAYRLENGQNIVLISDQIQKGLDVIVILIPTGTISLCSTVKLRRSASELPCLPAEFGALLPSAVGSPFPTTHACKWISTGDRTIRPYSGPYSSGDFFVYSPTYCLR